MSGTVHETGSFCTRCGAPRSGAPSCTGCGHAHDTSTAGIPAQPTAPYAEARPGSPFPASGFPGGQTTLRKQVPHFGPSGPAPALAAEPPPVPASVGARVAARLVDTGVLAVVVAVALLGVLGLILTGVLPAASGLLVLVLLWVTSVPTALLHRVLCERSEAQATPGKWLLGVHVRRDDGHPVTAATALGRFGAELLSGLVLLVGYLAALWHPERRTWHDTLSGTRVVRGRRGGGAVLAQITGAVAVGQLVLLLVAGVGLGSLAGEPGQPPVSLPGSGTGSDSSGGGGGSTPGAGGDPGDSEPGVDDPAEPPPADVWDGPVEQVVPVSVDATAEREPVDLLCTGRYVSYDASQLVDGDLDTGWGAGADDGTGESVTVRFAAPLRLTEVGLTPGYAKVGPRQDTDCASVPAFPRNRFVPAVQYTFDNGTTAVQRFERSPDLQRIDVDTVTTTVTITILDTDRPAGADDDTILSEAWFAGRTS